ncbi:MAG TPA: triose-phosphate isomerase [Trueperaceae bacterium]|nr:triose-phosphate isomerase [Trueperaceae bacterium]
MSNDTNQPVVPDGTGPRSRALIAGNWKMHKLPSEASAWLRDLLDALAAGATADAASVAPVGATLGAAAGAPAGATSGRAEVALLVPFTHLPGMAKAAFGTGVGIGAQDLSSHASGAYTGEVSGAMLKDAGATYVIVGHSERRAYHHEDDALVNAKLAAARGAGLVPILCVGESRAERDAGAANSVVRGQLSGAFAGFELDDAAELVVAYEPVWAIGTGLTATAADAQEMSAFIRSALRERFGAVGAGVRVLYGGSMKPTNAAELLAKPDIDGGLIGGASLDVADLRAIAAAA